MDSNEPLETVIEVNPPTGDDNEETNEKEEGVVRSSSHSESTHTTTQRWGERVTTSRGDTDGTQPLSVSSEPGHDTPAWNASEDAFEANQNGIHTSEDVSTTRRSYDTVSNFYVDVDGDSESTPSFSFLTPHDRRFGSPAAHSRPASALRNGQRFQYPEEETKSETLTSGRKPLLKSNSSHSSVSETKPEGTPGANSSSYADENSETNGSLANAGDTDSKQQKDESSIQKTKQSISEIEGWRVNASERNGRNISGNNVDTQVLLYKNMEEKSYIPVDLAQTYLRRAVEDMRSMKQRHVDAIHKIDHHYKEKSKQTKKQHEKEKLEIRKRAGERILAYQKRLEDKENEVQKFTETLEQAKRDVELKWSDENDNLRKDMYSANRKLYEHVNILEEDKTNYVLAVEQLKAQSVKYDERNNENKQMLDDLKKQLDTEASCRKKQVYSRECHISTLESQIQYWKALCQSLQEEVENSSKQSQQVEGLEKKMTAETLQMRKMIEQHESEQKATVDSKGDQRQSESILSNNLSYIEGLLQVTGDDVEKLSEEVERCEKMVAVSQSELDSEEEDYQAKHKEYKHLKHEIKDWIAAYEAEHNEKPDKEAKRAIKDKYKRYEALQPEVHEKPKKIEEAKQRVEDANAELRIARSRLQLAQALAKSNGRASAEADNQSEEEEYKDSTTNNDYSLDQRKEIEDLQKEKEGLEEELAETQEKLAELESKLDSVTLERDLAKARSITQARKNTEEGAEESNIDSSDVHSIVQKLRQLLDRAKQAIDDGAAMWKEGKKRDTLHLYQGEVTQLVDDLGEEKAFQRMKEELNATVDDANEVVSSSPGKAAVILRQGLDDFIQMAGEALSNAIGEEGAGDKQSLQKHVEELESRLQQFQSSHEAKEASKASETPKAKDNSAWRRRALSAEKKAENLSTKVKELEKEKEQLEQKIKDSESSTSSGAESKAKVSKPAAGSNPKDKEKIDQLQKNLKELRQKLKNAENKANDNQMSMQLKEAEKAKVQAEKRVEMVERKAKKEQEDLQKEMEGEVSKVQKKLERTEKTLKETEEQVSQLTKEKNDLKVKVGSLDSAEKELESLREKAEEGKRLKQELEDLKKEHEEISNAYREEQLLRKKYWNMMEDMKGKIRVYCRSRPLSTSELERYANDYIDSFFFGFVQYTFPDNYALLFAEEIIQWRGSRIRARYTLKHLVGRKNLYMTLCSERKLPKKTFSRSQKTWFSLHSTDTMCVYLPTVKLGLGKRSPW